MSTEIHTSTPGSKSRRKVVIAAVLASIALLSTGAVAYWSGDSWSDEAMSSGGFPGLPGGDWSSTTSDDGWGSADTSTAATSAPAARDRGDRGDRGQPTRDHPAAGHRCRRAGLRPDLSGADHDGARPVAEPGHARRPRRARPPPRARGRRRGNPNPKPKPTSTKKPIPTPSPSPTSSDGGCVLLIIC